LTSGLLIKKTMKTRVLLFAILTAPCVTAIAQDWNTAGNTINTTVQYLGCNGSSTQPLRFSTVPNYSQEWRTDNVLLMRLTETLVNQNWAWYQQNNLDFSGHLGIGSPVPNPPLTYLHVNGSPLTTITVGYRPWMRVGALFTQGTDGLYTGMRLRNNQTQGVVNWSDDDDAGPDPLSFVFTSTPDNTSVANTLDGLEVARMVPAASGNEGFLGVGDWFTAAASPTERLDVLDGRVRVRQLPTDAIAPTLTKFLVVDDTPGPDFGVVKWRNVPPGTGGGCEWTLLGAPGSSSNIATAYNGNPGCPQGERSVSIGTPTSAGKLTVLSLGGESGPSTGASITVKRDATGWVNGLNVVVDKETATGTSDLQPGIKGVVTNGRENNVALSGYGTISSVAATKNHGVYGYAGVTGVDASAQFNYGGYYYGEAINGATIGKNYGLYTKGSGGDMNYGIFAQATGGATNYGVYATASGSAGSTWAVWSQGNQFSSTGTAWTYSDENLKTNITDLNGGLETIMQLHPKTYLFRTDEYPYLQMADGHQYGLLAQEMEQVVPDLVRDVHRPADIDSLGNEIGPALDFKAVKYEGLIPILIAAVQEQQATITQLQDQINNCCAAQGGLAPQGGLERRMASEENDLQEQRLLIIPNTVADLTTLEYYVPRAGQVSLSVSTSDGKPLGTLAYSYPWNTTKLASGTYFCTYLLDGAVVVKRAVKVK
jgi:hypothetical protein